MLEEVFRDEAEHLKDNQFDVFFPTLISSTVPRVFFVTITPHRAAVMLARNPSSELIHINKQRTQKRPRIAQYATEMSNDNWILNCQGISFDTDGFLMDGQHRLQACIKSGCSFETVIGFGFPVKGFMKVDSGGVRTASDVFHMRGVKNSSQVVAALRWIHSINIGLRRGSTTSGASSAPFNLPTTEDIWGWHLDNRDVETSLHKIKIIRNAHLMSNSAAYAYYVLFARLDSEAADIFMTKVFAGVGLNSMRDPAYVVRTRLVENQSKTTGRLTQLEACCFLVKAWNATRQNVEIKVLRYGREEVFPKVV